MRILVEAGAVGLAEPDDLGRLHLELRGTDPETADAALVSAGLGRIADAGHARIDAAALHALAAPAAPAGDWQQRWSAMLDHARTRGWLESSGAIRVHIV